MSLKRLWYLHTFNFLVALVSVFASIACFSAADINVCSNTKSGVFLQDYSDPTCESYIVCMNGESYPNQKCDKGYLFNAVNQMCSEPSEVNCDICPVKTGAPIYYTAYPSLCNQYILCFGPTPVVRECAPGLQFDPDQERCNDASLVDCVANKCDAVDDVNNIQYVQSASNCSKYDFTLFF